MQTERIKLSRLKVNENNPRTISKEKFEKLVDSILVFPNMLSVRPIVVDEEYRALGGNMRTEALREIGKMSLDAILERLYSMRDYNDLPEFDKENLIGFWKAWLSDKVVDIVNVKGFSDEEKRQFIIKDNLGYGEWDWDILSNEWDEELLSDWGVDIPIVWDKPEEKKETQTERLSKIEYNGLYYEPKNIPNINLSDCINLDKFNSKINALDEYGLTEEQKDVLKLFAYRFIKIDFEAVANYYAFNATEEEQKAMERLRLVLTDNGTNGFIEDDMLRILKSDINYIKEDE